MSTQPLTDAQLAVALLNAIELKPVAQNQAFALAHPFERIRRCVSHWWLNRRSVGGLFLETPGIIVHWLNNWDTSSIPPLHPDFYSTDLYLRFRPHSELLAEQAAEQELLKRLRRLSSRLKRQAPPAPAHTAIPDLYHHAWLTLLSELQQSMPQANYSYFIKNNFTLTQVQEPPPQLTFTVTVQQPSTLDWIKRQLSPRLQRALKVMLGQDISIQFQTKPN